MNGCANFLKLNVGYVIFFLTQAYTLTSFSSLYQFYLFSLWVIVSSLGEKKSFASIIIIINRQTRE